MEVKRAANSQLRREVMGQLLNYVANATRYWRATDFAAGFAAQHGDRAHRVLSDLVGEDVDEDTFWDRVIANLSEGRARLLFLADRIPTELQAIVEFLNERIDPTEVLAVELRQYRTPDGPQVLVPRVIGSTAAAKSAKRVSMTYVDLLAEATETLHQAERLLLAWAERVDAVTDLTTKSRKFTSRDGVLLLYFYPTWETIEFTMTTIRSADPQAARQIADSLAHFSDRALSDKNPSVAVRGWSSTSGNGSRPRSLNPTWLPDLDIPADVARSLSSS